MSRVIHTQSPASLRKRLLREIATVLQEGKKSDVKPDQLRDMFAFISLTLTRIEHSVKQTTTAWEKRGYWLKADRFRLEWLWVSQINNKIEPQLHSDEVQADALILLAELAGYMQSIQPKKRGRKDVWKGAWSQWNAQAREA